MVIGDIGAGKGRYAVWFADRVGPKGMVLANDIDKDALVYLERRCKRHGISNITTVLGEIEDPKFPAKSLDLAFMVNVYHHLDEPVAILKNVVPGLKPGGILAIVEAEPEKAGRARYATPKQELIQQVESAGYKLEKIITFLNEDNIYLFILGKGELEK